MFLAWKHEEQTAFLREAPSQILQQSLKFLDKAIADAFDKKSPKGFPRFKKKGTSDSFRYPQGFKVDQNNSRVFLPKIGWIRYRKSRSLTGELKNITVSRSSGKWYISIQTEAEAGSPVHPSASMVGIDLGVAKFAKLSDGGEILPLNSFRKQEKKLAHLQRKMTKKVKFSQNWKKLKAKVQRLHQKIAHVRHDFLHKHSTAISKNHAIVAVEDLEVSHMSKSASGTRDNPGRNVRAKAGPNKSILDQGWGEFRRQLEYKLAWRGGMLLAVPPAYSSQKCSRCGHAHPDNRKTQELFRCQQCGLTINADYNAALNILAAGHAVLACGEIGSQNYSVKQEPAEASLEAAGIPRL
ncbi:MAG: hypothetical protein DDT18_00929 [Actinobacteria bacterium]|nr:hypothetical protein [Actinomycetota bacterium]